MKQPWTTEQYAEYMGISVAEAAMQRYRGDGPTYIKPGRRVYYDPDDVAEWLESNKVKAEADD